MGLDSTGSTKLLTSYFNNTNTWPCWSLRCGIMSFLSAY